MGLIRGRLLKLEALPVRSADVVYIDPEPMAIDGYDTHQIDYHLQPLEQARLVYAGGLTVA